MQFVCLSLRLLLLGDCCTAAAAVGCLGLSVAAAAGAWKYFKRFEYGTPRTHMEREQKTHNHWAALVKTIARAFA